MNKVLAAKRDELAKQWSDKPDHNKTIIQACISEADFKEGFDAGVAACEEMMGELVRVIQDIGKYEYSDLSIVTATDNALAKYEKWKASTDEGTES